MKPAATNDDAGEHDRYVFIEAPRCPRCDSRELHTYKSSTSGNGDDWSVTRYTKCGDCKHKFLVVVQ